MNKKRLGVHIDHVATVRNARGESYPSPVKAALLSEKSGADSITIHLREDRRHINEKDLIEIKKKLKIPLNLEMAATEEMYQIALKRKPSYVCIVPEKRKEITTEGGLNLNYKEKFLRRIISGLQKKGIRVSLFIEPKISDIKKSKLFFNSDCIEIHTGKICNLINNKKNFQSELRKIKKAAFIANEIGLEVHAGHGLNFKSASILSKIDDITEFNIGHFLIGDSIFFGLTETIKKFKRIFRK